MAWTTRPGRVERRKCRVSWPWGREASRGTLDQPGRNAKFVCRVQPSHTARLHLHHCLPAPADLPVGYPGFSQTRRSRSTSPISTYSSGTLAPAIRSSLAFDFDIYISDEVTAAGDTSLGKDGFRVRDITAGPRRPNRLVSHDESTQTILPGRDLDRHLRECLLVRSHRRRIGRIQGPLSQMNTAAQDNRRGASKLLADVRNRLSQSFVSLALFRRAVTRSWSCPSWPRPTGWSLPRIAMFPRPT